jgi:hypothetical protein
MSIKYTPPVVIEVQDDGYVSSADVSIINFAERIDVINDGYGKVTVSATETHPALKAGIVLAAAFAGNPKKATVTFATPFPSSNYTITILGTADSRGWTYESKLAGSFVINANASAALSGEVSWQAIMVGESV